MKFVAISDTHGHHNNLSLPSGDILLHTGDITDFGELDEVEDFLNWLSQLDFQRKIFIGGNHDSFLEEYPWEIAEMLPEDVTYLCHDGIEIDNISIWGSPTVAGMHGWTFGRTAGRKMEEHWQYMPFDTQILLTHVPPAGILDTSSNGRSKGCKALQRRIWEVAPIFHVFGHVHSSYGQVEIDGTNFINAAITNSNCSSMNEPFVFEL